MAYIHERPDWPNFTWDSDALTRPLSVVWQKKGWLMGRMQELGFSLQEAAILKTLTQDVIKSSEIEGENLDREQVRSSIARRLGIDVGALTLPDRNVEGVVEMMLDATQKYEQPLTQDRLFGWHASLFPTGRSGIKKMTVGGWRDDKLGRMQVVSNPYSNLPTIHFQAPEAARIDAEMKAFFAWFEKEDETDRIIRSAIAHVWFVTIHPFDDGNGRIARAIADMALARAERSKKRFYSMSAQIRTERNAYYDILEQTQKADTLDITPWLLWFLGCIDRALDNAETVLATIFAKADFWRRHAQENLNPRQRNMTNRLLDGFFGKLTSAKYAKLEKCSPDTALRDINDLIARGILTKEDAGGRSTSYRLVGDIFNEDGLDD